MKLTFYGADKEVTGSCHCVQVNDKKILIDCGLQQGQDEKNNRSLSFNAAQLDFAVVTHAHIDHSGRLPLLIKNGFRGKIYATKATCDLLSIMLLDSAHIQEVDAMNENRKKKERAMIWRSQFIQQRKRKKRWNILFHAIMVKWFNRHMMCVFPLRMQDIC